jgi:hypothetical protein
MDRLWEHLNLCLFEDAHSKFIELQAMLEDIPISVAHYQWSAFNNTKLPIDNLIVWPSL